MQTTVQAAKESSTQPLAIATGFRNEKAGMSGYEPIAQAVKMSGAIVGNHRRFFKKPAERL